MLPRPPQTITDPAQNGSCWMVSGITLNTAPADSFTSFTCAQCEPALIGEENKATMADLPILVFCKFANASSAAWCMAMSTGLTRRGPPYHPEVCFWLFGQKHAHQKPVGARFCHCFSWSYLHNGSQTGAAVGWIHFYSPIQLFWSPSIFGHHMINHLLLRGCFTFATPCTCYFNLQQSRWN